MSDSLTTYGYIKDNKVFLKAFKDFPEREIGVVRESEEQSLQYFIDRFSLAEKKVDEVKDAIIEYPNKGSYLMKIIHLKTYLNSFSGLGDFDALYKTLDSLEAEINLFVAENRKKNTEIKKSLLKEAEEIKNSGDWLEATKFLKDIKLKWIKTGSAYREIEDMLNESFDELLDEFFDKRKYYYKNQRKIFSDRRAAYKKIIEEMRYINDEEPTDSFERVKQLQQDWRLVGKVQRQKYMKLWDRFKKEVDFFFLPEDEKMLVNRGRVKKTGIELKRDLFAKVNQMLETDKISIPKVKKIQKKWKSVGKLPLEEDKELNLNFRIVCNEIFEAYFLMRTAKTEYANYDSMTSTEQIKVKIRLIRESIKMDEYELGMFNNKFKNVQSTETRDSDTMKNMIKQRGTYINKIKTKQRILRKLQDLLLRSY